MKEVFTVIVAMAATSLAAPAGHAQHLWWNLENQREATCVYGTINVLATSPGIYYCGANWHPGEPAGGYCGIQHNSVRERRTIFSIWDTSPQLHPQITEAGPETQFGRFGGEGEGGHTHMVLPWKVGETFQFFVQKTPADRHDTTDTRYYYCEGNRGDWRHLATITSPNGDHKCVGTIGGGLNSFLENFLGRDKSAPKIAIYRLWLGSSPETLKPLQHARGDGKWGQLHDAYFLAEGDPEKLATVFLELEPKYGKPVFGNAGKKLDPISAQGLSPDLIKSLKNLPRARRVANAATNEPRSSRTAIERPAAGRGVGSALEANGSGRTSSN